MIATSTTTELDGSTDAEHYARLMAEDNEGVEVDFIHGGDEDCAPFFVLVTDKQLSSDLIDWARIKGWEIGNVRNTHSGKTAVRFADREA